MDIQPVAVIVPLLAGILLAGATGLRAFLPLCVVSWAAYFDLLPLNESFAWIDSLPAVVAFTAAVVVELTGDKIPVVDHVLDALGLFVKPIAGFVIVAASLDKVDPLYAVIFGVIAGSSVATGVHLLKAKSRVLANAASFGVAAPVLSFLEDGVSISMVLLAILVPLVAVAVVVLGGILVARFIRRWRAGPPPERPRQPETPVC